MRRQKVSTESPDCGCDIVFDCLNGWRCCKVNYWVFVMTVFAVYSLIVLIVPCLGPGDMRGAHNISGSRKVIQSHTNLHSATLCMRGRLERLACFIMRKHSWETGKCRNADWCIVCNPERSQFAVKGLVSAPVSRERGALMISITPGWPSDPSLQSVSVSRHRDAISENWKLKKS